MKFLAIGAFASVLTGPAVAAQTPPPATIDDAGVTAWIKTYLKTDSWTVIAADGAAVVLGSPDGVGQAPDGTITAQIRHEFYRPVQFGDLAARSNSQTWNVDCASLRMRILDITIFEDNNLAGRSQARSSPSAQWTPVDMASTRGRTVKRICEAPTTGQRLERPAAVPAIGVTEPTRAHPDLAAATPFRFEAVVSYDDMAAIVARTFTTASTRDQVRAVFVEDGGATLIAHPREADVEKYIYDINLCSYYVWRWNVSADYGRDGRLAQIYINGTPQLGAALQPALPKKGPFYEITRPRPQAYKGEKALKAIVADRDGNLQTTDDMEILTGVGPTRADPLDMGHAVNEPGVVWRSIFDFDEAKFVAPYSGDCAAVDAKLNAQQAG